MLIETEHSKIYKTAQETGKISNKQYNLTPKGTRKKEQMKLRSGSLKIFFLMDKLLARFIK